MMRLFSFGLGTKCLRGCSWILLVVALSSAPALLFSQSYFGTVTGVLTDPTGAVITAAKVTLDRSGTRATRSMLCRTARAAISSAPFPPGVYSVTAEMPGFEKSVRTGIRVDINVNATANLSLKVSSSSQTVEVNAQSQALDVQDATTGLVIDRKFINDLPLVDRYVMDLTMLTPGVTEADDQCAMAARHQLCLQRQPQFHRRRSDGWRHGYQLEPNGGVTQVTYTPSSEAVDEFRVEQSNFSAEYGFSGASVVNMITRSGTNTFHGSATISSATRSPTPTTGSTT
jgi:hypothetical protein